MTVHELLLTASEKGVHFYLKNNKLAYKAKKNTLTLEFKEKIALYQSEIKFLLENSPKDSQFVLPPIDIASRDQSMLASFAQQRLWFVDQLEGSLQYNNQGFLEWFGTFDRRSFKNALTKLIERHEVLRTYFSMTNGELQQIVVNEFDLPLIEHDLSDLCDAEKTEQIKQFRQQESETAFNLNGDLMLRARLITLSNKHHLLLYTLHHIASDGWSNDIFKRELNSLYNSFNQGQVDPLLPLKVQYADYAQWQRDWLAGPVLTQHLDYWEMQLANLPQVHSVPLDRPRPKQQNYRGHAFNQFLDPVLTEQIKNLCEQNGVTLFMFLETVLAVLIGRYSFETDIVIGTPIAGRSHQSLESLIGFFVNTLVLRTELSKDLKFSDLLQQNKKVILDAYAHQHIPFEMLVEKIRPERNSSHSALFQILFVVQNTSKSLVELPEQIEVLNSDVDAPISEVNLRFDLALHAVELKEEILINWSYRDSLFNDETIKRMAINFKGLLRSIIKDFKTISEPNISELDFVEGLERECLVRSWNANLVDYPNIQCIHQYIEAQVQSNPDAPAVIYKDEILTFRELNERSNCLAHYLIAQGVMPDTLVGLSVERSFDAMIGLLGILKSGGAYVPLDPSYPDARLSYMLQDSAIKWIVTQSKWLDQLPLSGQKTICLDMMTHSLDVNDITNPEISDLCPDHAAYVIYTSGSTGQPKGVVVNHASVANFLNCAQKLFLNDQIKGSIVSSPLAFDATVQSLYVPLIAGKYIEFLAEDEHFLNNLSDYLIDDDDALLFKITPTHLKALSNQTFIDKSPFVKHVIVVAGESLTHEIIRPWIELLPGAQFINEYGPTEATVGSCTYEIKEDYDFSARHSVPIGRPLDNVRFYVLNQSLKLQPIGAPGELYISGAGLAREYLNQPELTDTKFIQSPFSDDCDERLYKTGDLVRYLSDGNLLFLGRIDDQIKLRGFRIELGDIEGSLLRHSDVYAATVVANNDALGETRLIAYVVMKPGKISHESDDFQKLLRKHLLNELPEYMVPATYILLEKLPETPSGKVDKNALPIPPFDALDSDNYLAPTTEAEKILVKLWSELLSLPESSISTQSNFFALGGHSLLIMQLITKLQTAGYSADIRTVMKSDTLVELANALYCEDLNTFEAPPNLIPHGSTQITPQMLTLVNLSEFEVAQVVSKIPGGAANVQDIYPLVPLQEGILFHHLLSPNDDPYILDKIFVIAERAEVDLLLNTLQRVINRHDVLRTAIIAEGIVTPVQVVQRHAELQVQFLTLISDDELQSNPMALKSQMSEMNLSNAPLIRVMVSAVGDRAPYYFHLQTHHIISDHISSDILWSEVEAILAGSENELPNPAPYRNFVAQSLQQNRELDEISYFSEQLGDIDEPCLAFGLKDVRENYRNLKRAHEVLDDALAQKIRAIARKLKMSPASIFHAAWALVVGNCSGKNTVVFGTVLSGRLQGTKDGERMLGLFLNTLPIRFNLQNCSVRQLVNSADVSLKSLLNYEQSSLVVAQKCSGVSAEFPLFNSLLNYRHSNALDSNKVHESAGIIGVGGGEGRNNYPISIAVSDWHDGFAIKATTAESLSAERIVSYLVTAITQTVDALHLNENTPLNKISLLPPLERQQLLLDWNQTNTDYSSFDSIQALFELQVKLTPDATAVIYQEKVMTYQELNEQSNRLANYLIANGVKPDSLVALCVDRSSDAIIGLMGILKSGGAYVPLDPSYPKERLSYMLNDSNAQWIVTQSKWTSYFSNEKKKILCMDDIGFLDELNLSSVENPVLASSKSSNSAYVIYTSGSTGRPKGVVVNHSSVVNFLQFGQKAFLNEYISGSVVSSPLAFDATVQSLYVPLCAGKYIVLLPEDEQLFDSLTNCLLNESVGLLFKITPTHLKGLKTLIPGGLAPKTLIKHVVVVAGERLTHDVLKPWVELLPNSTFINEYGPTEATVGSCTYRLPRDYDFNQSHDVPIGQPLANVKCYVLNESLEVQPIGAPGELYIGGAGLAREYLNRPDLTESKFIINPFSEKPGDRLYRTGDLVQYLANGNLLFLGRIDEQVKIRGFRIELGEIESCLLQHDAVESALVLAQTNDSGDTSILAYVIIASKFETPESPNNLQVDLRQYLEFKIPSYMIPAAFVILNEFPLTPNGKINKKALPLPTIDSYAKCEYIPPETKTELFLTVLWGELLQKSPKDISVKDNFFALGGHSLLVIRMISKLQINEFPCNVKMVMSSKSLFELAEQIDQSEVADTIYKAPANLIPEGCDKITPEMLPLVELTDTDISVVVSAVSGGAANIKDIYPLAPLQEGILFHHLLSPENDPYVLGNLFVIENKSLVNSRIDALQRVIDRHDVLRTLVITQNVSQPIQVVLRGAKLAVHELIFDSEDELQQHLASRKSILSNFSLSTAPLIRVLILSKKDTGPYYFYQQSHHIITDHIASAQIRSEVELILSGQDAILPAPVPYREFIAQVIEQNRQIDAEDYFRIRLADVVEPILPFGLANVRDNESVVEKAQLVLDTSQSLKIRSVARYLNMSPAALFHAAWALVISSCSGHETVVFGTVLSGRLQGMKDAERMLGLFMNTLPIRLDLNGKTVKQFIIDTDVALRELLKYEQSSLALAQNCSGVSSDYPLFSAIINYRHSNKSNSPAASSKDSGIRNMGGEGRTNYPIELSVSDWSDEFSLYANVHQGVSAERVIEYVVTAIEEITGAVYENEIKASLSSNNTQRKFSDVNLNSLSIIPKMERQKLLVEWNDSSIEKANETLLHKWFEKRATIHPHKIALTFNNQQLSYGELNSRANQLAHFLIKKEVGAQSRVGICVNRSIEMVIGLLAILKAGACYVPLDPKYPSKRLAYIIDGSDINIILTHPNIREHFDRTDFDNVLKQQNELKLPNWIDISKVESKNLSSTNPNRKISSDNLAYIIYTSGSTGAPKGVSISHGNAANFIASMMNKPGINHNERFLAVTTLGFDIAVLEIYLPLSVGAMVEIANENIVVNGWQLAEHINVHQITMFQATPASWKLILDSGWKGKLDLIGLVGGEALPTKLADEILPKVDSLWNMYGPTETTVWSTCYQVLKQTNQIAIGKPIGNTETYVLDNLGRLSPLGVPGELYIGGDGLSHGYIAQPGLTSNRFLPNPFSDSPGSRLYRTGDLVRYQESGDLEYLGRIDNQVKLRGYRIELGEIEKVLLELTSIKDAIALVKQTDVNDQRIVAYIVKNDNSFMDVSNKDDDVSENLHEELLKHAQQNLPNYMIPSAVVELEQFPLTDNGKIDRNSLLNMETVALRCEAYMAPRNETEIVLVEIWADILQLPAEDISVLDSFFNLGGHSLLAIKLVSKINSELNTTIVLSDIFRLQELEKLASHIDKLNSSDRDNRYDIERLNSSIESNESQEVEEFDL